MELAHSYLLLETVPDRINNSVVTWSGLTSQAWTVLLDAGGSADSHSNGGALPIGSVHV